MPASVPVPEIKEQLERMRNRKTFRRAEKLGQLLKYLVEQAMEGRVPSEWEIARDVFGEGPDWINDQNRKVAIYLGRLNRALTAYYSSNGEGKSDPVIITIVVRKAVAEYRPTAPFVAPQRSEMLVSPIVASLEAFFIAPEGSALRCVVTGQTENIGWHHLDGDPCNLSVGNLIPLCGHLRSHIEALKHRRKKTSLPALDPKHLGEVLAPKYFRQWEVPSAYGCATLAFYMGEPPYGEEPATRQVLRLCDIIHYARHHFFEPLMHQVIRNVVLPFLSRAESIDPIAALRLSLQLTALLEEAGYYADAEASLALAAHVSRNATSASFERGSQNAFTLLRRRAQLLAEREPKNTEFYELFRGAQQHTVKKADRILTLNVVQVHRWLRLGSPTSLRNAYELLAPLISDYNRSLFQNDHWVIPQGLGAADFSEVFLLAAITACRLRPGGWKHYAEEAVASATTLMDLGGHILPAEYGKFIAEATDRNNAKATRMLRISATRLRPPLRDGVRENITAILKCLARLRLLEYQGEHLVVLSNPDL